MNMRYWMEAGIWVSETHTAPFQDYDHIHIHIHIHIHVHAFHMSMKQKPTRTLGSRGQTSMSHEPSAPDKDAQWASQASQLTAFRNQTQLQQPCPATSLSNRRT